MGETSRSALVVTQFRVKGVGGTAYSKAFRHPILLFRTSMSYEVFLSTCGIPKILQYVTSGFSANQPVKGSHLLDEEVPARRRFRGDPFSLDHFDQAL